MGENIKITLLYWGIPFWIFLISVITFFSEGLSLNGTYTSFFLILISAFFITILIAISGILLAKNKLNYPITIWFFISLAFFIYLSDFNERADFIILTKIFKISVLVSIAFFIVVKLSTYLQKHYNLGSWIDIVQIIFILCISIFAILKIISAFS